MASATARHVNGRLPGWQRALADDPGQVLSLDIIHREERLAFHLADFVDGDNVRVPEARGGLGLALEPFHHLLAGALAEQQHLDRDDRGRASPAGPCRRRPSRRAPPPPAVRSRRSVDKAVSAARGLLSAELLFDGWGVFGSGSESREQHALRAKPCQGVRSQRDTALAAHAGHSHGLTVVTGFTH